MKCNVIIPAAGTGKRFGASLPKQFVELGGIPIIIRTIKAFEKVDEVEGIVVSVHNEWYKHLQELLEKYDVKKVKEITIGGIRRQDSVANAIFTKSVEDSDVVLVHDAVRPFVSPELIKRVIETADEDGAVIPVIKSKDTIKEISAKGVIKKTFDRSKLGLVQTPQGYWLDVLQNAFQKAQIAGFQGTDSSSLVEFNGYNVSAIEGDDSNIKITTPYDFKMGELILNDENKV